MKEVTSKFPNHREMIKFKAFLSSMRAESDRASAILGSTLLDSLLEKLLRKSMIAPSAKQFFSPNSAPSFYRKIEMCYSFGLISTDEYSELHIVRKIRNQFAHKLDHKLSFNRKPVKDWARELVTSKFAVKLAREVWSHAKFSAHKEYNDPRWRFEFSVTSLFMFLTRRIKLTKRAIQPKGIIEPFLHLL